MDVEFSDVKIASEVLTGLDDRKYVGEVGNCRFDDITWLDETTGESRMGIITFVSELDI